MRQLNRAVFMGPKHLQRAGDLHIVNAHTACRHFGGTSSDQTEQGFPSRGYVACETMRFDFFISSKNYKKSSKRTSVRTHGPETFS